MVWSSSEETAVMRRLETLMSSSVYVEFVYRLGFCCRILGFHVCGTHHSSMIMASIVLCISDSWVACIFGLRSCYRLSDNSTLLAFMRCMCTHGVRMCLAHVLYVQSQLGLFILVRLCRELQLHGVFRICLFWWRASLRSTSSSGATMENVARFAFACTAFGSLGSRCCWPSC